MTAGKLQLKGGIHNGKDIFVWTRLGSSSCPASKITPVVSVCFTPVFVFCGLCISFEILVAEEVSTMEV